MKPTDTKHTLSAEAPADPSLIASGVMGIPTAASHHRLATVSTHELVQKIRQKELDPMPLSYNYCTFCFLG